MIQEVIIISPGVASDPPPSSYSSIYSSSSINPAKPPQIPCPISPEATHPKQERGPAGWSLSPNLPSNLYTPSSPNIPSNSTSHSQSPEATHPKQGRGPAGWSPTSPLSTCSPSSSPVPSPNLSSLSQETSHQKQGRGPAGLSLSSHVTNSSPKSTKSQDIPTNYPALDVRRFSQNPGLKTQSSGSQWTESDVRSPSVILNELVRLSRQTKGEHYLPNIRRQEDKRRVCILCSVKGFICLGKYCLGKKISSSTSTTINKVPSSPSTSIPGTICDKSLSTSTLTLQTISSQKSETQEICWDVFSWEVVNNNVKAENPYAKSPVHLKQNKKTVNFGPADFPSKDITNIVKRAKFSSTSRYVKVSSLPHSTVTSLSRKLSYSEKACQRKDRKISKAIKRTVLSPPSPSHLQKPTNLTLCVSSLLSPPSILKVNPFPPRENPSDAFETSLISFSSTVYKVSSWGHLMVGLKGGTPDDIPHPSSQVASSAAISANFDTVKQFECHYCGYRTDTNAKLKKHKIPCKKKSRNEHIRCSSIPRSKDALTKDLVPGDIREHVPFESSPKMTSQLDLWFKSVELEPDSISSITSSGDTRPKLLKKQLNYNKEFHDILTKSSASPYDKYMLCRAANICVPDVYPFINIRSSNNNFSKTSRFCLTDTQHLINIMETSSNKLSETDERKFIVADNFIEIQNIETVDRGKEVRPNAFTSIEVIQTANPNIVKFVLNKIEILEVEDSEDEIEEAYTEAVTEEDNISTAQCWGSRGWQGVIKKTKAEISGQKLPEEIAASLAEIDLDVITPDGTATIAGKDDSEPMDSQESVFHGFEDENSEEMECITTSSPIGGQLDGMNPILPPFVPAAPIPNVPGAPPQIQPLYQHLLVPVGPGLPPNGQFGLVGPFIPLGLGRIPNAQILNCRNQILAALAPVPSMTFKDAEFLFLSILNAQNKFKPLANPSYFPSSLNDTGFQDLTGLSKLQFYDLRNRLIFCGLDFSHLYKGNCDTELFRTLCYARSLVSQRSLSALTGTSKSKLQNHNWAIILSTVLNVTILPQFLFFNGNHLARVGYWNTLAAVTRRHAQQFEIYSPLCRNGEQLLVVVTDSTKYRTSRSNDVTARKATYCGYTAENDYTQMTLVDLDGNLIWASGLLNSRTPQHGDGNIIVDQILREQQQNLQNGFWAVICVSAGFKLVLLADTGYAKYHLNPHPNTTLEILIANRNNQVGQRIYLFTPTKPGGNVWDRNLNNLGPDPQHFGSGLHRRLTAREANVCRVLVTSSRSVVEQSNSSHSQYRNNHKHEAIEYQMLEPIGNLCPYLSNQPRWWALSMFSWGLNNKYHLPFSQTYALPPGYNYGGIGRAMLHRIEMRNPYDGLERINFQPNLWSPSGQPYQRNPGQWTRIGGAGLLNPAATGLPFVPIVALTEITLGSYQLEQAQALASANRVEEVLGSNTHTDRNDFHNQCSQPLQSRECFYFDLHIRPQGWNDQLHGTFVPHRILKVTKIKSSHSSTNHYDVIIGFVPLNDPNFPQRAPNRYNFVNLNLADSIIGWCCGPAGDNKCPVGARQAGCCTQATYVFKLGMCIAHNPNLWVSKHQSINSIDINMSNMSERERVELMAGISN